MTQHTRSDLALALLRAALGIVFVMHGAQKVFVLGHDGVTGFFASVGIPLPAVAAAIVMAVELGGGLAILAGVLTRLAGGLLAATMAVAILAVHLPNGFFLPNGYEFTLILFAAATALVLAGAGRYSVDALWLPRREARTDDRQLRRAA